MEEEREMQVEKEEEMDRWKRRRRGIAGRGEEEGKVEEERDGKDEKVRDFNRKESCGRSKNEKR